MKFSIYFTIFIVDLVRHLLTCLIYIYVYLARENELRPLLNIINILTYLK